MPKPFKYAIKNFKAKMRTKIFGPHAKGILYDTKNGFIAMPVEDVMIGKHLGFKGGWNMDEIELLDSYITKEDTIYVVGTHVGTLLIPLARKAQQVVGYEANPETFWYLNNNIAMNGVDNVKTFNYAVGNREGNIKFYQSKVNTGGSKIKPKHDSPMYSFDNPDEIEVPMVSLDAHIQKENLPHPTCVIMDIEGAEYLALQGMLKSIQKLRFLYVEYVPHHLKNVAGVTSKQFMELILPHFSKVLFIKTMKTFELAGANIELMNILGNMEKGDKSDDLLFTN